MATKLASVPPLSGTVDFENKTELLTADQIGERLQLPPSWVRRNIPAIPLGRYRRWRWSEVLLWLANQRAK